jgi:hypothetical protein
MGQLVRLPRREAEGYGVPTAVRDDDGLRAVSVLIESRGLARVGRI